MILKVVGSLLGACFLIFFAAACVAVLAEFVLWLGCKADNHCWKYHPVVKDGDLVIVQSWRECQICGTKKIE